MLFVVFNFQKYLADILSVLALTMSAEGERVHQLKLLQFLIEYSKIRDFASS
jgi:hypothetical protein